jgi:hypothetical protein
MSPNNTETMLMVLGQLHEMFDSTPLMPKASESRSLQFDQFSSEHSFIPTNHHEAGEVSYGEIIVLATLVYSCIAGLGGMLKMAKKCFTSQGVKPVSSKVRKLYEHVANWL